MYASYRENGRVVCPRSGSASLKIAVSFWIDQKCFAFKTTYSFTLTSGARLMSVLDPGVMSINCRPIERLAASIYYRQQPFTLI